MTRKNYAAMKPAWESNLLNAFQTADLKTRQEGMTWYPRARSDIIDVACQLLVEPEKVIGVTAALSPSLSWDKNIVEAKSFIQTWLYSPKLALEREFGVYGHNNKEKAARIMTGAPYSVLGELKVRNFAECLRNPYDQKWVAIDGHAKCAADGVRLGIHGVVVKPAEYPHYSEIYRKCANSLGLLPSEFQAIVWLVHRQREIL